MTEQSQILAEHLHRVLCRGKHTVVECPWPFETWQDTLHRHYEHRAQQMLTVAPLETCVQLLALMDGLGGGV